MTLANLRRRIIFGITAVFCCLSTAATALGISTCNPDIELCVNIVTGGNIAKNTQILSTLSYDINKVHSQSPSHYDWISPNTNYFAASLPIDLLSKAQITNLSYTITEINRLPIKNCGVKTPAGQIITAGTLTIYLFFNTTTHLMNCISTKGIS